jgi:hypothetical protein
MLSFVYYLFFVNLKDPRYFLSFLPFLYVLSIYGLLWMEGQGKRLFTATKVLLAASVVIASVFAITVAWNENHCASNDSIIASIDYLSTRTAVNDTVLSNVWPWLGYALNVKVSSLWDTNITGMIESYRPLYVVYNDKRGIEYDRATLDNSPQLVLEKEFAGNCESSFVYRVIGTP